MLHERLSGKADFPEYIPVEAPPVVVRETTLARAADDPVSRALALIADRACQSLSVREVAASLSLSPQSLHARFQARLGRSPGEEVRRVKLATAKSDLRNPHLTISEVASRVGYSEQNKLTNFFKRETGMSPSQWRKNHL